MSSAQPSSSAAGDAPRRRRPVLAAVGLGDLDWSGPEISMQIVEREICISTGVARAREAT
jgi:hypothetical protein